MRIWSDKSILTNQETILQKIGYIEFFDEMSPMFSKVLYEAL